MKKEFLLGSWIKRFLLEYLITLRNLSRNTQHSYRDTFRLLLPFISRLEKKSIENLLVEDIKPKGINMFLLDLESSRKCSQNTKNQRLAAIRSFAQFVALNNPEYLEWCNKIRTVPYKKYKKTLVNYLEKSEMDALLKAPNRKTEQGRKDYAILLFLYNTGTRADEVAQLTIADLSIASVIKRDTSTVKIKGKGNKLRRCPLWENTAETLSGLICDRSENEHVFLNRYGQPITRFGIHTLVRRNVKKIIYQFPALKKKKISPHTIRHTTATHLLRAGVDINTIRAWLGHVSINTTNIYAEVDMEMKSRALAHCEVSNNLYKNWHKDKSLMSFLNTL